MANTSSAKKAARKMLRRTEINKSRRSRLKAYVRKVEEALASGDKAAAKGALAAAEPILMRTAQKGVIHKKSAVAESFAARRARSRRWPERGLISRSATRLQIGRPVARLPQTRLAEAARRVA